MDHPITEFLLQQQTFSTPVLLSSYSKLNKIQKERGHVTFEDVTQSFHDMPPPEAYALAYVALMYEAILVPMVVHVGPSLVLRDALIDSQENFLSCIQSFVDNFLANETQTSGSVP